MDHTQLTQQLSLIRQLLRELGQPQSVLHEALARYHMGNYKLWISTAALRWGKCWLKQRYPQTTTGLLLQFLKGRSWAYSHTIFINDLRTERRGCPEGPTEVCTGTLNRKKDQAIIEEKPDDLKNCSEKTKMKFNSTKCKARDWANTEKFCCELAAAGNDRGGGSRFISPSNENWQSQMWHGHEKAKCNSRKYQVILAEMSYCYSIGPSKISSELLVNCG